MARWIGYTAVVRAALLLCVGLVACTRMQTPDIIAGDPSTKPVVARPSATATLPDPVVLPDTEKRICEPTVRCGYWSGCVYLERLDATHFRALGGKDRGETFVRRHNCHTTKAGALECAVYCAPDGKPCVDGLQPVSNTCDKSLPPQPNREACLMGGESVDR